MMAPVTTGRTSSTPMPACIFLESPLAHPSVMLRRERIIGAGGYRDGAFPEDYELWLRLHRSGHRLAKLKQPLLDWRDEPGRLSRRDPRYARSPTGALLCGKPWRPRVRRPRALTHGLPQGQRLPARRLRRCGQQQCLDTL
jgi:hypothetical protein